MMKPNPVQKRAMDPTMRPPPGYALTQPKGKYPWEKPAQYADPNEAVSALIDKMEQPENREQYLKLMLAGFAVEDIVNSIAISGFMQGKVSVDTAELIKGPIGIYLMAMADENNIPAKMMATESGSPEVDNGMDDYALLEIMKKRNPTLHRKMVAAGKEYAAAYRDEESKLTERRGGSFLGSPPPMMEQEEMPLEQEGEQE